MAKPNFKQSHTAAREVMDAVHKIPPSRTTPVLREPERASSAARRGGNAGGDSAAVGPSDAAVRLIFPASAALAKRIDAYWHKEGLKSRSEAIRVLLEEALGK